MDDILVVLRSTPLDSDLPSPFQSMFRRQVKSIFPIMLNLTHDSGDSGERTTKAAEKVNNRANRIEPAALTIGQDVYYLKDPTTHPHQWSPATVKSVSGLRSCVITDKKTGVAYDRNIDHVKPHHSKKEEKSETLEFEKKRGI